MKTIRHRAAARFEFSAAARFDFSAAVRFDFSAAVRFEFSAAAVRIAILHYTATATADDARRAYQRAAFSSVARVVA